MAAAVFSVEWVFAIFLCELHKISEIKTIQNSIYLHFLPRTTTSPQFIREYQRGSKSGNPATHF